jgi:glycogen synthase
VRIAIISYEGGLTDGGIGTYVRNASEMLSERGHDVVVFSNGNIETNSKGRGGEIFAVVATRENFSNAVLPAFSASHASKPFDVIESAEYGADAAAVAAHYPNIARVVRLHTPTFFIREIDSLYVCRLRRALGSLRRGHWPRPSWVYDPLGDPERLYTLSADVVTVPSLAMLQRIRSIWGLSIRSVEHFANVFTPSPSHLAVSPSTKTRRVTFLGRLEPRKGVIELAQAIPIVLREAPGTKIRIVGRSSQHPNTGEDLRRYIRRVLGRYADEVEFIEVVPRHEVPLMLASTDICVFPSVWENFPYVCLEAMSAARAVIGSSAGGMAEIIEHGRTGLLIPPRNHKAIALAMLKLLSDPKLRIAMGTSAREQILRAYGPAVIAPLQEASYARAIEVARRRTLTESQKFIRERAESSGREDASAPRD